MSLVPRNSCIHERERKMGSMANYIKLLEESWKELQNWVADGKFDPNTEADI